MPDYRISLADGSTETMDAGDCKITSAGCLVLFAPSALMMREAPLISAWAAGVWTAVRAETEDDAAVVEPPPQQVIEHEPEHQERVLVQATDIPDPRGMRGHPTDFPFGL